MNATYRNLGMGLLALLVGGAATGCGSTERLTTPPPLLQPHEPVSTAAGDAPPALAPAQWFAPVEAYVVVPDGWVAEPLKTGENRDHQVWISPTGSTAYGVLTVRNVLMPLASDERVLNEFLKGMKQSEGVANLLDKRRDEKLAGIGGLRFVAEGGQYKVRASLVTSGTRAWIVYAGTRVKDPVVSEELARAEAARDRTQIAAAVRTASVPTASAQD